MTKTYDVCRLNGFAVTLEELEEMYQVGVKGKFTILDSAVPLRIAHTSKGKLCLDHSSTEVE